VPQHPKAEFDAYSDSYDDTVNSALAFSGLKVDFFTRVKADYISQLISGHFTNAAQVSVLDVGCGVGNTISLLIGKVSRLAGVDVSEACIAAAKKRPPGVEYATYDGIHLPYPDANFDVAFAICVFHHVPLADRAALARDIRRVLRPGGLFVIFEHNPYNPLTMRIVNACEFDKDAILLRRSETETLMRGAGLQDVSSRYILTVPAAGPFLHRVDRLFSRLPMGAQYYTAGVCPGGGAV
jgi:SAM-dependent methyltransferase